MFNKNRVPRQARGSTAKNDTFLGDAGQLTVDLGKFTIRVHDGSTVGGHPLAKEAIAISAVSPLEITQGGTLAENTEIGLRLSETEGNVLSVASDGGLYVAGSTLDNPNKADIDLSNLNAAGQKILREAGFPSSNYINMSWTGTPITGPGAASMEFIAPVTGYCLFSQLNSSGSSQALIDLSFWPNPDKSGVPLSIRTFVVASYGGTIWIPIVEGGLVYIGTNLNSNIVQFACISAIGSV